MGTRVRRGTLTSPSRSDMESDSKSSRSAKRLSIDFNGKTLEPLKAAAAVGRPSRRSRGFQGIPGLGESRGRIR